MQEARILRKALSKALTQAKTQANSTSAALRGASPAGLAVLLAVALSGCHSTPPPTPLDQLNAQQRMGYDVFQTRCALCHNERTGDPKNGPSLLGVFKKPSLPSGAPANDERVTATVLHGRGMMPAQPNLDPDALAALLAYLHTV